ncbi:alpha/beta fold hydrolase [Clostridium perfringens]|uniref:alpha/beta fold hydrolase n=1 Tax=Clostridium perfringens TaxID=1502 RepID=UPI001A9BB6EC|nr:alpha/beta fold hydrolase [Clostridium perfringens]
MNAIIFHGSAPHATADKFWYKNIAHSLNALGISTIVADLPKLDQESLTDTLVKIREMNLGINQNTILIGHSAGTNIILALLEQLTKPVKAVYLIAGYCQPNGMRHTTLKNHMIGRQSRRTQMSFIYSIHLTILSIVMKSKEEVYLTIWVEHLF